MYFRDRHIDPMTKLNYFFCHHVVNMLNISHNFIIRSSWGYRNDTTGQYDGMIGDMQSGLAEIGGKL